MDYKVKENKTTPKIIRLLYMYILSKNYGGIEYSSLTEENEGGLKFSKKTFEKDLQCMRKAGVVIVYDKEYKNYRLGDKKIMEVTMQNPFILKINRLYRIINYIQETNKFTKEWYQNTFNLSTRTMARDIKELKQINIAITYYFDEGQYEINDSSF